MRPSLLIFHFFYNVNTAVLSAITNVKFSQKKRRPGFTLGFKFSIVLNYDNMAFNEGVSHIFLQLLLNFRFFLVSDNLEKFRDKDGVLNISVFIDRSKRSIFQTFWKPDCCPDFLFSHISTFFQVFFLFRHRVTFLSIVNFINLYLTSKNRRTF